MSVQNTFGVVTSDVALDPSISPTAKAVYLVLAVFRDRETDECYPSNRYLAAALGISERTVIRALRELSEGGVIRRVSQHREGRQVNSLTVLTDAVPKRPGRGSGVTPP